MTYHRLTNIALTLGLATAFAAVLSIGPALDDHSAEWNHSTPLRDAQQQAQTEARRERAAAQLLCSATSASQRATASWKRDAGNTGSSVRPHQNG